ncbi:hypothetical protein ABZW03_24905, partial [Kitasatospora sp. NPDC004799]|uniref:hypothetical protein n=1 Tax=Kitasatospora sp. NPDC004799 TaxID=3154460 RepID=UPI0033A514EB
MGFSVGVPDGVADGVPEAPAVGVAEASADGAGLVLARPLGVAVGEGSPAVGAAAGGTVKVGLIT